MSCVILRCKLHSSCKENQAKIVNFLRKQRRYIPTKLSRGLDKLKHLTLVRFIDSASKGNQRKEDEFIELLRSGLDPNFEGGWPMRLAARYGCSKIVETLIQFGANPHLLSESGASTLQLAVFSGEHWNTDKWTFLLSCCDSSQLADGAAVAIIFNNDEALKKILATGRCNTNIPTTLTGKTLDILAKGYKLTHLLNSPTIQTYNEPNSTISPRISRQLRNDATSTHHPHSIQRNLSPSVARFFHQTAGQTSLSPTRRAVISPSSLFVNNNS